MPHTTHPSHQRPCGWNAWLTERQPRPALSGQSEADVVIIGAGYTGFAAASAWQQARPEDRIKILEADQVGEGSQGVTPALCWKLL